MMKNIFESFVSNFLFESDDNYNYTKEYIRNRFQPYFGDCEGVVRSKMFWVNKNPNTKWIDYLIYNLRHTFGVMKSSDNKYLPWLVKIVYSSDVNFDVNNDNGVQIYNLIETIELIHKDSSFFAKIKNITNYNELMKIIQPILDKQENESYEYAYSKTYGKTDYEIKEVETYSEAERYGKMSCPDNPLCYCINRGTWDSYKGDGANKVYVCLKNGWEDVPCVPQESAPYDDYGLSMIFVFIDPNGNITTANTRWNHENSKSTNVDHAFTKKDLCDILNVNFYEVFKPYTAEELRRKGF